MSAHDPTLDPPAGVPDRRRLLAVAGALAAVALFVPLFVVLERPQRGTTREQPALVSPAGLVAASGVRVVRVAVTGGGGLVDLRYRVVVAEKADALHAARTPPLLIDERTGGVLARPLMGHIHHARAKVGLTYYVIFENSGELVRPGTRVTVQLGNARLPHVAVQ